MGKAAQYPKPKLRLKAGAWRIRWSAAYVDYEFATGHGEDQTGAAETMRAEIELAIRTDKWPDWTDSIGAVQKWRGIVESPESARTTTSADALEAWRAHYAASIERAEQVDTRYKEIKVLAGKFDLLTLTPDQAAEFVRSLSSRPARYFSDQISAVMGERTMSRPDIIKALESAGIEVDRKRLATALVNRNVFELIAEPGHHRTGKYRVRRDARKLAPRTRNDYLIACGMFYKWAFAQGLVKSNPFEGIKRAARGAKKPIIYCTRDEREDALAAAEGESVELAINIAFYAGLRKGEIIKLRWEHIDIARRWIHIYESKTKKPRNVPISPVLLEKLTAASRKSGYVVPALHAPNKNPEVVADSFLLPLKKKLPHLMTKLRWNVFRHTFGSILAQAGKSIDQICALMGNTPDVCREHYAQLIPNAAEQTGIDLID